MINAFLLFVLGLLFANAGEWVMHKYFLHGLGMQKTVFGHITGMNIIMYAHRMTCMILVIEN